MSDGFCHFSFCCFKNRGIIISTASSYCSNCSISTLFFPRIACNAIKFKTVIKTAKKPTDTNIVTNFFPSSFSFSCLFFFFLRKAPMRYVLEFSSIILPHPTKFCQCFILLIENFNLYSDEDGVKHIRIKARPNKWHENDCPFCHKSCPVYDKHSSRPTTWRGLGNCRPLCQSCSSRFRTGALKKT